MADETFIVPIDLPTLRRIYARQLMARAVAFGDCELEEAFATVPREDFLGAPPWNIIPEYGSQEPLISSDPVILYQDSLIALQPQRAVNNGCPGLHAFLLHAVGMCSGERVAHIGAGTGYYSAIMARLVGPGGHVTAVEFDAELAERARAALAPYGNVTVINDDGARWPQQEVDVVYVNFGAGRPADSWIDNLAHNGRLMFPLTAIAPALIREGRKNNSQFGKGHAILVTRRGNSFAAKSIGPVAFVQAEGDLVVANEENERLFAMLPKRTAGFIRSLKWREPIGAPERYWHIGSGWALGFDEPSI